MHCYFAYGSNMLRARLEERVGPVQVLGPSVLDDYAHAFSKFGRDGTGKGNIHPRAGAAVHGVVYALNPLQLAWLGVIEGGYQAVTVRIRCLDRARDATTYEALAPRPGLRPSAAYFTYYERGMEEHSLPLAYRALVRAQAGLSDPAGTRPSRGLWQ
ncbi:gamma-glutamylcyclotransferase family protein [Haliangium sp.]|uniref:gamma-glutamylcyclotransferase family protein n=1 Tax=Haliangium sp. TaxID=2663208 RepID=UPI003D1354CB